MNTKIGVITHYYDKIGVAVVKLDRDLKKEEKIRISGHDNEFDQQVNSMQMDYKEVDQAKAGEKIGLKVDQPVKEKDEIFLITE